MNQISITEEIINTDELPRKKKNVGIKRESVENLLNDLINQAKYINEHPDPKDFPITVKKLWVYGSYLNSDKPKLGDIDIFYEFQDRWEDTVDASYFFVNKDQPSSVRCHFDVLYYPEIMTLKFLRNKHRSFSFNNIRNLPRFLPSEKQMIKKEIYSF